MPISLFYLSIKIIEINKPYILDKNVLKNTRKIKKVRR